MRLLLVLVMLVVKHHLHLQERDIKYEVLETDLENDTTLHCIHIPDNANVYVDSETYMRMRHPDLLDFIGGRK